MSSINILNVKIDPVRANDVESLLCEIANQSTPGLICTPNTEFIMLAQKNKVFCEILNNSSLNLPDGIGVLWAAKFNTFNEISTPVLRQILILLEWLFSIIIIPIFPHFFHTPIPERLSGSDFIWQVAEFASKNKYRVFLLGGGATIAERTALALQTKIPELRIAGVHSGGIEDTREIIESINKTKSDIVLVAFGAPKQEKWLSENLIKTRCKFGVGLGGTFDFIAGTRKRAPMWMRKSGLEWLHRLIHEPLRIKRQMALPRFMFAILKSKLKSDV